MSRDASSSSSNRRYWTRQVLPPVAIGLGIALMPVPDGLTTNAWLYFALFAAVIAGIITEPAPPALLGLGGVSIAAVFELVRPSESASAAWALSGFANTTVWLIFAAYVFALGYSETGLGRRIALHLIRLLGHKTLGLGYAVALADLLLGPFTASATARSAGTIYPVIRNIPELYGSQPDDPSARKIGAYLLYTAVASASITSSLFITALAPNAMAISLIAKIANVTISWMEWFVGFAPAGLLLFALLPLLVYKIYPPGIKEAPEAPRWAGEQLELMGPISSKEVRLLILVSIALSLWIFATEHVEPAMAAVLVLVAMVLLNVVSWSQVIGHHQGWNVLIWFATLVTLAAGLAEVKFVAWLANVIAPIVSQLGSTASIVSLVGVFYFLHYFFASITAHTASLLPVFLTVALQIPTESPKAWALFLAYTLGIMGTMTPYGGGHVAVYYGSGFIESRWFWLLGLIFSVIFFVVYITITIPWLRYLGY